MEEINSKGVRVRDVVGEKFIPANTITVTRGFRQNLALAAELKRLVPELYIVGDCQNPARMADATKAGYIVGCRL